MGKPNLGKRFGPRLLLWTSDLCLCQGQVSPLGTIVSYCPAELSPCTVLIYCSSLYCPPCLSCLLLSSTTQSYFTLLTFCPTALSCSTVLLYYSTMKSVSCSTVLYCPIVLLYCPTFLSYYTVILSTLLSYFFNLLFCSVLLLYCTVLS